MNDKSLNGLLYGLVAGLIFSLSVWGLDAVLLSRASAAYPWAKLVLGGAACMMACGLAGWISARVDHPLFSFLVWLAAGVFMAWVAGHMPFEGMSIVFGLFDPELNSFDAFPFVYSAEVRMKLLYFLVGGLSGLGGVVGTYLVESGARATYMITRLATFAVCAPIFLIPGLAIDDLVNQRLRNPIIGVDDVIQNALKAEQDPVSPQEARDMHLRTLDPVKDQLHKPRRLSLGDYDETSLSQVSVVIDFDSIYAQCWTAGISPTFCQRSDDRYLDKFACLLRKDPNRNCGIKVAPSAEDDFQSITSLVNPSTSTQITKQVGTLLDVRVDNQGESFDCRLRTQSSITLESCTPSDPALASGAPAGSAVRIFEKKTPRAAPTQTPDSSSNSASPGLPSPTPPAQPAPGAQATQVTVVEESFDEPPVFEPYSIDELTDLSSATQYTITVDVNFQALTFTGRQVVNYTNAEHDPQGSLFFRLFANAEESYGNGSLIVNTAVVDGQSARTRLSLQDSALEVTLPRSLAPGESLLLELEFTGVVPSNFGGGASTGGYGIYNFSSGVLALAGWYPILAVYDEDGWNLDPASGIGDSVYADIAFYTVDLTTGSELVVASTGTLVSRKISGDTASYRFSSGPVREFFMIMSPYFGVASTVVGDTRVNSYYLSGFENAGEQALEISKESLEVYNQRFGIYPYTEIDVVQAPMRNAAGVEFPGIILIGASLYENPGQVSFIVTVAHEVAHQWWYNLIGNDVIDEPWLDEALTSYSSAVYLEDAIGQTSSQGLINNWQNSYEQLVQDGKDERVTQNLGYFESLNDPRVYGTVAYRKGALFYDALRKEIGDQAFFDGLRIYYDTYRYQIATTAGLLEIFEQTSGRQLDDLTDEWLYSPD